MARLLRTPTGSLLRPTDDGRDPWRDLLGPLLDRRQVRQLLGLKSARDVTDLVAAGRLLALPTEDGAAVFPAFQFDATGGLDATIGRVLTVVGPVVATPYTIASWLRSPNDRLGGRTPVEWLELGGDPDEVIGAAELAAARLAL